MLQVRRVYTPRPGDGGKLLKVLKQVQAATEAAGFPPLALLRRALGPHGTLVTVQRWPSLGVYDESRERVRQTVSITQLFQQVYPLLAVTHETELYEEVE